MLALQSNFCKINLLTDQKQAILAEFLLYSTEWIPVLEVACCK